MSQEALPLAGPFDELAVTYDASFTKTALGVCLRTLIRRRLDVAFASSHRVLELGCGTGEDAIYLARRGLDVLATDTSIAMLQIASEKAERAGCAERIQFRAIPMQRLGSELAGERFDGVCSNFGAVNCVAEVDRLVADIAPLLEPDARLVWSVMGRHVPWEWAWFLVRADWRRAFRRARRGGAIWRGMRIMYPTPRELKRILSPHFDFVRSYALGLVLPPTYAARWLDGRPRLLTALARVERATWQWQALSALADHYIIEGRRTPAHADG